MSYLYRSKLPIFLGALFFLNQGHAATNTSFPIEYGASLSGIYSDNSLATFDLLLPIIGQPDHFFFFDPQGLFHSQEAFSGSAGAGYRALTNAGILSGYAFLDYNHDQSNGFWFVSPGISRLGEKLDFSANMYIPVSSQRYDTGLVFADQLGNYDYVTFQEHQQIDALANTFASTGPGFDAELGYRLPFLKNNTRIYAGTYYFQPKDNEHITGAEARINLPLNKYFNLTASEAYDNVAHNTAKLGLIFNFGGRKNSPQNDLMQRLVDPLSRNLVAITGASNTAQPVSQGYEVTGQFSVEQNNIWFFSPTADSDTTVTTASCTANNPCALTQDNLDDINDIAPNANLYVASGSYTNLNSSNDGLLALSNGQSMFGRSDDYTAPADQNALPLLFGALELPGNNTLELIELLNNGSQDTGIVIDDDARNIFLNTLIIGNDGIRPNQAYTTGIKLGNNDSVYIVNSKIYAFSDLTVFPDIVAGIELSNVSNDQLIVVASTISAISNFPGPGNAAASYGVFVGNENSSGITTENNQVWLKNDSIFSSSNYTTFGVFLGSVNSDMALVQNNSISIDFSNITADNGSAIGVFLGNFFDAGFDQVQGNTIDIYRTNINANTGATNAYGIFLGNYQANSETLNNTIRADAVHLNAIGAANSGSNTFGIFFGNFLNTNSDAAVNQNSLTLSYSQVNAQSSGSANSTATGVFIGNLNSFGQVRNEENTLNIYQDAITAQSVGVSSNADGIAVSGFANQVTVENSSFLVSTDNTMSFAMGVEAFQINSINLINDEFTLSATHSSAAGFVDSGQNNWNIDNYTLDHTTITAANQTCLTVNIPFGSGCL